MYFATKKYFPAIHKEFPSESFHTSLVRLTRRYENPHRLFETSQPTIMFLKSNFNLSCLLFASPWTAHSNIQHCSQFESDAVFGAHYDAFNYKWNGVCWAEPPFTRRHINRTLLFAIAAATQKKPQTCILLSSCRRSLQKKFVRSERSWTDFG